MACGFGVVFSKNPVYSAFCLILSFFGLSALYVLWGATFIAMIQVLIYTGAIVVLFVFVVMLLNLGRGQSHSHSWLMVGVSGLAVGFLSLPLFRILSRTTIPETGPTAEINIRVISKLLFSQYLWPFEVLSLFLLAMIVAIFALTRSDDVVGGSK